MQVLVQLYSCIVHSVARIQSSRVMWSLKMVYLEGGGVETEQLALTSQLTKRK